MVSNHEISPANSDKLNFRIVSWYMTYVRSLGRGFTFDDPDTTAFLTTTASSIIYFVYNVQINIFPEQYGSNLLYQYGDMLYFIGACYYVVAALRDENCFWFLPLAGQYGVAPGRVQVETKALPQYGKAAVLITDICQRRVNQDFHYRNDLNVLTMANPMATSSG